MVELQGLAALLALVAVYVLARRFVTTPPDWKAGKPTVGIRKQWFSWERAALRSFSQSKQWSFEGYAKVRPSPAVRSDIAVRTDQALGTATRQHSKANSPFIIPCAERGPVVLVPPQQIRKVYGLPENVLDMWRTSNVTIQSDYTIADRDIVAHPFQINVIRNQMTRNLDILTPVIAAELEAAFERHWGSGDEWREFQIWDSCLSLIAGASNAAFCGAPLCQSFPSCGIPCRSANGVESY